MVEPRLSWKPLAIGAGALVLVGGGAATAVLLTGETGGGSLDPTARVEAACGIAEVRPEIEGADIYVAQEVLFEAALFAGAAARDDAYGDLAEAADSAIEAGNTIQLEQLSEAMAELEQVCTEVSADRIPSGEDRFEGYVDLTCRLSETMPSPPPEEEMTPESAWILDGYAMAAVGVASESEEAGGAYAAIAAPAKEVGTAVVRIDEDGYTEALTTLRTACEDR